MKDIVPQHTDLGYKMFVSKVDTETTRLTISKITAEFVGILAWEEY